MNAMGPERAALALMLGQTDRGPQDLGEQWQGAGTGGEKSGIRRERNVQEGDGPDNGLSR